LNVEPVHFASSWRADASRARPLGAGPGLEAAGRLKAFHNSEGAFALFSLKASGLELQTKRRTGQLARRLFKRVRMGFPLPSAGNPLHGYLLFQKRNPSKLVHADFIGHADFPDLFEYRF
jgi:hypothetical protein